MSNVIRKMKRQLNNEEAKKDAKEFPSLKIKKLNRDVIEEEIGYRPFTTFFEDFSIAEHFGTKGIMDTYRLTMSSWKNDIEYLTELAMVMSWKCGYFFEEGNAEFNRLYHDLYYKTKDYVYENFEEEEDLEYFYNLTD